MTSVNGTRSLKAVITHLIPFIIFLIPCNEIYTYEMKLFIVFTTWMLLWAALELTDLFVPAIMYPVLLIMFKVLPANIVYSSYLSTVIFVCIAGIVLSSVLDRIGLLRRISYWIIIKCGGSFTKTVFALFIASTVASAMTFMGAILLIAAMCFGFCLALNLKPGSREAAIIMMTGMLAASTVRMFIYCPAHVGIILGVIQAQDPTFSLNQIELLKYNWPVFFYCLLFIGVMIFINKKHLNQAAAGMDYFQRELAGMGKVTGEEKKAAVIVIVMMLAILTNPWHKIDGMIIIIIACGLLFFPGINIGKTEDTQKVSIGMILFIGSCMAIGSGCTTIGITQILTGSLAPILKDMSHFWFLMGVMFFGIIMNIPMTPLAMLAALTGPLYAVGITAGVNPIPVSLVFLFSTDMVFMPFQFVTFLIFFSFGMMSNKQFIKYHALKDLLFVVFFVLIIVPYWKIIGLL